MTYDKTLPDGSKVKAPSFTYRVMDSAPVVFQLAEWLLVIVAFQYADAKFGFFAAKIAWVALSLAFALYFGVLCSNVLWRVVDDPFKNRSWDLFSRFIAPLLSGVVIYGLQQLVRQMVVAQG